MPSHLLHVENVKSLCHKTIQIQGNPFKFDQLNGWLKIATFYKIDCLSIEV